MKRIPFFVLFAIFACGPSLPCNNEIDSASSGAECCEQPEVEMICPTHPFGRKPYCDEIERPQTNESCFDIFNNNPNLCFNQYEACRIAIREANCNHCPIECQNIEGACN